jgi:hypothetical protein
MTRSLALNQRQVTALCKGAEKAGHVPVVEIDGIKVTLVPTSHIIHKPEKVDEEEDFRL